MRGLPCVIALCNALPSSDNAREARNESAADCAKQTYTSAGVLSWVELRGRSHAKGGGVMLIQAPIGGSGKLMSGPADSTLRVSMAQEG